MVYRVTYYHHPLDKRFSLYRADASWGGRIRDEYEHLDLEERKVIGYSFKNATGSCLYTKGGEYRKADDLYIEMPVLLETLGRWSLNMRWISLSGCSSSGREFGKKSESESRSPTPAADFLLNSKGPLETFENKLLDVLLRSF